MISDFINGFNQEMQIDVVSDIAAADYYDDYSGYCNTFENKKSRGQKRWFVKTQKRQRIINYSIPADYINKNLEHPIIIEINERQRDTENFREEFEDIEINSQKRGKRNNLRK